MAANTLEQRLEALDRRLRSAIRAVRVANSIAMPDEPDATMCREMEPVLEPLLQRAGRLAVQLGEGSSFEADEVLIHGLLLSDLSLVTAAFRSQALAVKSRLDRAAKELTGVRRHVDLEADLARKLKS